jgi:LPXTG-motif cell wall-anchored protein
MLAPSVTAQRQHFLPLELFMNAHRAGTGLAAVALTGLSLFGMAAPASGSASDSGGSVSDSTVTTDQVLTATTPADSFAAGTPVEVGVESRYQRVGQTTAAANGSAQFTFNVPDNLAPGQHNVIFTGAGPNGAPNTVRIPFTVVRESGAGAGSGPSTAGTALPLTGRDDLIPLAAAGAGLVVVGAGTVVVARRRRSAGPMMAA